MHLTYKIPYHELPCLELWITTNPTETETAYCIVDTHLWAIGFGTLRDKEGKKEKRKERKTDQVTFYFIFWAKIMLLLKY